MEIVDVEEETIFNNVFQDYFKDNYKGNQEFLIYLSELSSYGIEKLNEEPWRLEERRAQVLNETRAMAFDNYKTFIQTANCCKDIFQDFQLIEQNIEGVLQTLPEVTKSSRLFLQQAKDINASRKVNNQTLMKYAQILEVLEVAQLMDTCVRNEYYEESLELLEYVARLERKLMHIPLIQNIVLAVKQSKQQMLQQLLQQLRSTIQLPECLKVVGFLRRMGVLPETQLRIVFLQARDACFQGALQSIPKEDAYQHISKSIEVTRVHLFDITTQYRAIFADDYSFTDLHTPQNSIKNSALFHSWISQKMSNFLKCLSKDLKAGVGDRIDSLLAQAMYFGLSFGRVGLDFRPLLMTPFQEALLPPLRFRLTQANTDLTQKLKHYTLLSLQTTSVTEEARTSSNLLHPPSVILNHPPLASFLNHLLTALNDVRNCLLFPITCDVIGSFTTSLHEAVDALIKFYKLDQTTMCEREEDEFGNMCECMLALVTHVAACVQLLFDRSCLQEVLGNVFMQEKEMAEASLSIDVEAICKPLKQFILSKTLVMPNLPAPSNYSEKETKSGTETLEKPAATAEPHTSTAEQASATSDLTQEHKKATFCISEADEGVEESEELKGEVPVAETHTSLELETAGDLKHPQVSTDQAHDKISGTAVEAVTGIITEATNESNNNSSVTTTTPTTPTSVESTPPIISTTNENTTTTTATTKEDTITTTATTKEDTTTATATTKEDTITTTATTKEDTIATTTEDSLATTTTTSEHTTTTTSENATATESETQNEIEEPHSESASRD